MQIPPIIPPVFTHIIFGIQK